MNRTVVHTDGGHRYRMAGSAYFVDANKLGVVSLPCLTSALAEMHALVSGVENTRGDTLVKTDFSMFVGKTSTLVLNRLHKHATKTGDPLAGELTERFALARTGREITVEQHVSKGVEAIYGIAVCDMLERYARRAAYVLERTVQFTELDLPVSNEDNLMESYATLMEEWEVPYSQARRLVKRKDA